MSRDSEAEFRIFPLFNSQNIEDRDGAIHVVQLLSCVRLSLTSWTAACLAFLSSTISQSLHKLMSLESVMLSNHLILCHRLLLLSSVFPSIRFFFPKIKMGVFHQLIFSFFFLAALSGCGILVPQPGVEPSAPVLEGQSSNHWITR